MALMLASAPRRAKRVDGGAPSVEGLGHGRLAQLAERWPHMLRPEIGPLGKSLTCRGVFLSPVGWRRAVLGGFEPVAGITAGITEQSSSDLRNTNLAWGFGALSHFVAIRRVSSSAHVARGACQ